MHYYQHHIGDYDRDTAHLTLVQHGAYGKLMRSYYATERPLPADASCLWRICGAMDKAERMAVSFVAEKFFKVDGDVLRHKRIDEEIKAYHDAIETAQRAGRASGEARRKKRTTVQRPFERKANDRSTTVAVPLQRNDEQNANGTATNQPPTTKNHILPLASQRARGPVSESPPSIDDVLSYAKDNVRGVLRTDVCMAWHDARERDGWKLRKDGHLYEFEDWRADLHGFHRIWMENENDGKSKQRHGHKTSQPPPGGSLNAGRY